MHFFDASVTSCFFLSFLSTLIATRRRRQSCFHALHFIIGTRSTGGKKIRAGRAQEKHQALKHFFCPGGFMWFAFRRCWKEGFFAIRAKAGASAQLQAPNFIGWRQRLGVIRTARPPCFFHEFRLSKFFPLGEICICFMCFQQWGKEKICMEHDRNTNGREDYPPRRKIKQQDKHDTVSHFKIQQNPIRGGDSQT